MVSRDAVFAYMYQRFYQMGGEVGTLKNYNGPEIYVRAEIEAFY